MLPELRLEQLDDRPVEWKLRYKRLVTKAYEQFAAESTLDWSVTGNIEARVRTYDCYTHAGVHRAQGILYCDGTRLLEAWGDTHFERRASWGDLFFAPLLETVVESYCSRTLGMMHVARGKSPHEYRLLWTYDVPASRAAAVLVACCPWRDSVPPPKGGPPKQWTMLYVQCMDDHPQYGAQCYVRLIAWNEPARISQHLLQQLQVCEGFCRDARRWDETYSPEARRLTDLQQRQ